MKEYNEQEEIEYCINEIKYLKKALIYDELEIKDIESTILDKHELIIEAIKMFHDELIKNKNFSVEYTKSLIERVYDEIEYNKRCKKRIEKVKAKTEIMRQHLLKLEQSKVLKNKYIDDLN